MKLVFDKQGNYGVVLKIRRERLHGNRIFDVRWPGAIIPVLEREVMLVEINVDRELLSAVAK